MINRSNRIRGNTMRKVSRLKVLDWYVHQGHQREFFKLPYDFYLVGSDGRLPLWNRSHRPLPPNVTLINQRQANMMKFDVIMCRASIGREMMQPQINKGTEMIGVVQTTDPYPIPPKCKSVVWNSLVAMNKGKGKYKGGVKNNYIVHGYDPNEFTDLNLKRSGVLTVANVFKRRSKVMGHPLWSEVDKDIGHIRVIGHGNSDMSKSIKETGSLKELIRAYNQCAVYFNPTKASAMPRSRAEAMMCGAPIISTKNFGIGRYIRHGKDGYLSNNKDDLVKYINLVLDNPDLALELGAGARESAIKHFHIDDYLEKWIRIFEEL